MENPLRILVVEDLPSDVELIKREIKKADITCIYRCVDTRNDFINGLNDFHPDFILSDYALPQFDGMKALRLAKEYDPNIPFIIVTGSMNEETAVACLKAGAEDYVIKKHIGQLGPAILGAMRNKQNKIAKLEAEEALHVNEKRLRTIVETSSDGIVIVNKSWTILYANQKANSLLNLGKEKIIGSILNSPDVISDITECDIFQPNGSLGKAEMSVVEIEWDNEPALLIMLHDITNRKQDEEKIKKLNRIYAVLSSINKTIVRVKELDELFNDVCMISVDIGKYNFVCVGLLDEHENVIKIAHWKFESSRSIENLTIPLNENNILLNTPCKVFNEDHYIFCNDINSDESIRYWYSDLFKENFQSVANFPLHKGAKVIGIISFFSEYKDFFDKDEINLLDELSSDISFSINSLQQEKLR